MKNNRKPGLSPRVLFILLAVICIAFFGLSVFKGFSAGGSSSVVSMLLTPMQNGINSLGDLASGITEKQKTAEDYESENESLKEQVEILQSQLTSMENNLAEYNDLLELLELSEKYPAYDMTAARIIGKDPGNWYDTFTIDKGSNDGIQVDMNVIADNGLVGIVTSVTPTTAVVRSIIDDTSNVSAMFSKSLDLCIVNGDLTLIDEGLLNVELISSDVAILKGDEIVTSYISDLYLPGILIGYISEMTSEVSDVTYTASLTPAVDFQHLSTVLVITQLKADLSDDLSQVPEETQESETVLSETEDETGLAEEE